MLEIHRGVLLMIGKDPGLPQSKKFEVIGYE
jgi:hypothetical protein